MIRTLLRIGFLNLSRDRVSLAMVFLLPIAFFSIFALVFGNMGRGATERMHVAVVDEDRSAVSGRLVGALKKDKSLVVLTEARPAGRANDRSAPRVPIDRARALELVRGGTVPVAIVLPKGMGESLFSFGPTDKAPVEILSDKSDPIAPQVVTGLLQKAAMTGASDLMVQQGLKDFEKYAGPMTPEQRSAVDRWMPYMKGRAGGGPGAPDSAAPGSQGHGAPAPGAALSAPGSAPADSAAGGLDNLIPVKVVDVMGEDRKRPLVAFYAAGIGVMFLLFSCTGAGGSLLEEAEHGTIERLLGSRLGMGRLLAGKWLFLTLMGTLQLLVMFTWGMVVFGLDLLGHLPGAITMIVFTSAAGAGFGLCLAALSRTRAQLSGYSVIIILVMSALGGSMFPRFLMSPGMQKLGLLTFNGWALDGFIKVFWRDAALPELWPQLLVLAGLTAAFLALARGLARRWESV